MTRHHHAPHLLDEALDELASSNVSASLRKQIAAAKKALKSRR